MDLEKIATSAIVSSISKTDTLSGFINDGDKEPCWDGNIYIHENSRHSKKNIKRIPTQVKGKAVKTKSVIDKIIYITIIAFENMFKFFLLHSKD